jgi:thymidine phosphorylase
VRDLGAGRMTQEATIDHSVGLDEIAAVGEPIEQGGVLCRVHARTEAEATAALTRLRTAFGIVPKRPPSPPRIVEVIQS